MTRVTLLHLVNELCDAFNNRLVSNLVEGLDRDSYDIHVGSVKRVDRPMEAQFQHAGAEVLQ